MASGKLRTVRTRTASALGSCVAVSTSGRKSLTWTPPMYFAVVAFAATAVIQSVFFLYLTGALVYLGTMWNRRNADRKRKLVVRLPDDTPTSSFWLTREGAAAVLAAFLVLESAFIVLP